MSDKKDQEQSEQNETLPDAENDAGDDGGDDAPEASEPDPVGDGEAPAEPDAEALPEDRPPTYEELEDETAKLKDQLLRTLADAENRSRRSDREKSDLAKYAIANFAREITSVADNLRRALSSVEEDQRAENESLNNFCVGIEMTEKELFNVFSQAGIHPIEAMGRQFDHNQHQAMLEVEDDSKPAGTVVQELQQGYMINDRLLRPAMVGVSKGGPKPEPLAEAEAGEEKPTADKSVSESSQAYEKRADAADHEEETSGSKVDTKL